jgi:putative membrane protein
VSDTAAPSASTLPAATKLAVDRTRLAYDRTLLAWIRTATSLISFGFTIYKFFQLELAKQHLADAPLIGPREFALLMIGIGLCGLVLGFVEHHRSLRVMRSSFDHALPRSIAGIVAVLVSLLGLLAILAVILRQ